MTNRSTHRPIITLPLLIAYVEALLPVLSVNTEKRAVIDSNNKVDNLANELLWVLQDNTAISVLHPQLNHHLEATNSRDSSNSQLSTLSALAQKPVLERYELTCFWLPELSAELLQHYIPLLMRYRDLYATHLLVALDSTIDLRAYGFTPFDIVSVQTSTTVTPITSPKSMSSESGSTASISLESRSTASDSLESISSPTLWQFNLYDYKQLPNWFNANHWANPENWNKRRW